MNHCPGTDALTTIAGALEWDVEQGIAHLGSCASCGGQLRALRDVRTAYAAEERLPDVVTQKITAALAEAAALERTRRKRSQNLGDVVEALLAGGTALAILNTGGMDVPAVLSAAVFAVVATSLFSYRVIRSSHSTAVRSSSPSIQ